MNANTQDPSRYPNTAAVQAWIDKERASGLVDFKLFVNVSEKTTTESLSCGVLELLHAEAIAGVKLD